MRGKIDLLIKALTVRSQRFHITLIRQRLPFLQDITRHIHQPLHAPLLPIPGPFFRSQALHSSRAGQAAIRVQ